MPHLIETVASVEPYRRVLIHGWNLAALSFGRQRGLTSYFRKAWFRFEPWIIVWQSVQGMISADPALMP